jgi:hypothetical protein
MAKGWKNLLILFNDTVRAFMMDFMAQRLNVQLARLKALNENAFMFVDEPGLQFLFSAMAGYGDQRAKGDLDQFFAQVERPRGIHLCGNPDWDFLLNLDLDVVSLDVYTNAEIFSSYAASIRKFLDRNGVIVWGIVPTGFEAFQKEEMSSMIQRLEKVWQILWSKGVEREQMIAGNMLPGQSGQRTHGGARLCVREPDGESASGQISAVKSVAGLVPDDRDQCQGR